MTELIIPSMGLAVNVLRLRYAVGPLGEVLWVGIGLEVNVTVQLHRKFTAGSVVVRYAHCLRQGDVKSKANGTRALATGRQGGGEFFQLHRGDPEHIIGSVHMRTRSEFGGSMAYSEVYDGTVAHILEFMSRLNVLTTRRPLLLWLCQVRKRCDKGRSASDAYKASTGNIVAI